MKNVSPKKTTIEVHLQPGAKKNEIIGLRGEILYVRITALPQKGQANRVLLALLARWLAKSKSDLFIVRGYSSKHKVITVAGLNADEIKDKLSQLVT